MKSSEEIGTIAFTVFYHPFEEKAENADEIEKKGLKILKDMNFNIIDGGTICDPHRAFEFGSEIGNRVCAVVIKTATWSSDDLLTEMLAGMGGLPRSRDGSVGRGPVFVIWGVSDIDSGSMCGAQQFIAVLYELGIRAYFIFDYEPFYMDKLRTILNTAAVRFELASSRFGIIGHRTGGMMEVAYDDFSVSEVFGARIYRFGLGDFDRRIQKITEENPEGYKKLKEIFTEKRKDVSIECDPASLSRSYSAYLYLREIISENGLAGITIECYPDHMGITCPAFSLLSEGETVTACEGDINSLILMFIMRRLSGRPVHHIDPLFFYPDESLLGTHCGCGPLSLADEGSRIKLSPVRLADTGCCVIFNSATGPVTVANLIGRRGTYRLTVFTGEAVKAAPDFPGNPIRIKCPFDKKTFFELTERNGTGHHWVVAYGNLSGALRMFAEFTGIKYISIPGKPYP